MGLYSNDNFNSHAHVERDDNIEFCRIAQIYFNSHAHVERDVILDWFLELRDISTHTLTWSVTLHHVELTDGGKISTHTLTWSVTLDVVYIWCLLNVMRTYFFI